MHYSKCPLNVSEQIDKLESRGLHFPDKDLAAHYLQNISYSRLRAFTYPFQDNSNESDHEFLRKDLDFKDIVDLYVFDRRLRSLVFNEIEKVEVALRTQLSLVYSVATNDPLWYNDKDRYKQSSDFERMIAEIKSDVDRSNEDFIKHYKQKYDTPLMPPSWMTLEVVSMGTLSRLYKNLISTHQKRQIAHQFGLGDEDVLSNWLHALSFLRNCCAHHSRIWNRRFLENLKIPYNTLYPFIPRDSASNIRNNKLFLLLSAIKYIVDVISPNNSFKANLTYLLSQPNKLLSLREMGFPKDWKEYPVWKAPKSSES